MKFFGDGFRFWFLSFTSWRDRQTWDDVTRAWRRGDIQRGISVPIAGTHYTIHVSRRYIMKRAVLLFVLLMVLYMLLTDITLFEDGSWVLRVLGTRVLDGCLPFSLCQ